MAAVVLGTSALSGCAAGMISQTADQIPNHDGSHATTGPIGVSNVLLGAATGSPGAVAWPAGSSVPLTMWVTNDAFSEDTLTSITSSAGDVSLSGDAVIPAQGALEIGGDSAIQATIDSTTADLKYGFPVDVDLYFADAGKISVKVSVTHPDEREADRESMDIYPEEEPNIWTEGD